MVVVAMETVLVHDPVGPRAARRSPEVEHKCLLHADDDGVVHDGSVLPGRLPEPFDSRPEHAKPGWILSSPRREKVALNFCLRVGCAG